MAEPRIPLMRGSARTVGRVRSVGAGAVIITTPNGQTQEIATNATSTVLVAAKGTRADLSAAERVVVKPQPSRPLDAMEVIVLPADNAHGLPVTAVAPQSISVTNVLGEVIAFNTAEAMVDRATDAGIDDVTDGATVFVQAKVSDDGKLTAEEIIVLPAGTTFGT